MSKHFIQFQFFSSISLSIMVLLKNDGFSSIISDDWHVYVLVTYLSFKQHCPLPHAQGPGAGESAAPMALVTPVALVTLLVLTPLPSVSYGATMSQPSLLPVGVLSTNEKQGKQSVSLTFALHSLSFPLFNLSWSIHLLRRLCLRSCFSWRDFRVLSPQAPCCPCSWG